jgi:hypothetical protein
VSPHHSDAFFEFRHRVCGIGRRLALTFGRDICNTAL